MGKKCAPHSTQTRASLCSRIVHAQLVRTLPHHRATALSRNDTVGIVKVVENLRVLVVF